MEAAASAVDQPAPVDVPAKIVVISLADFPHSNPTVEYVLSHLKLPPLPDDGLPHNDAKKFPLLTCKVDICPGVTMQAWAIGPYVFYGVPNIPGYYQGGTALHIWGRQIEEVDPFVKIEPIGKAFHKTVEREQRDPYSYMSRTTLHRVVDSYGETMNYNTQQLNPGIPWNYLRVGVTVDATKIVTNPMYPHTREEGHIKCPRPEGGVIDIDAYGPGATTFRVTHEFFGLSLAWDEPLIEPGSTRDYDSRWFRAHRLLQDRFTVKQGKDALWKRLLGMYEDRSRLSKGVKATFAKKGIRENIAKLKAEEPLLWSYIAWLHNEKTRSGVSNNTLLAAFFEARGTDYEGLKTSIRDSMADALSTVPHNYHRTGEPENRDICLRLPGAKDKDEEKRAHKEWYLRKTNKAQAEGLGVSALAHPKLLAAIEAGNIPLNLFHKTGDQLHLINVEFDLWEKALERKGWAEVLFQIAQSASGRSKYEKEVTSYLAFLFRIEKYLDRHTGKGRKWQSMPTFVNSEWQLEMEEANEEGTTKRRSALTPIPDNEARTITVPYVSMRVSGAYTTYCYSLDYQVFEEMTIDRESGTPIVNELERRLNGRDDYGLMYYTLTGTARNTGYPTFLIIFERRKDSTHVHFHRVHPNRSKEGKPVPASRVIEECYRYMAGNIRAEEIFAQQGDLIFIKAEHAVEVGPEAKHVKEFESHAFKPMEGKPILLIPNESKSIKNRLGFIYCEGIFTVDHPEHEPIKGIPAGMYEVRRCKSWEANPKAVWSLTID